MSTTPTTPPKTLGLNNEQVRLLTEVISRSQIALTPESWNALAGDMGISNGKAAKERFRYLMAHLNGTPLRSASKASAKTPSPPKVTKSKSTNKKATESAETSKKKINKKKTKTAGKEAALEDDERSEETPTKENIHDGDADMDDEEGLNSAEHSEKKDGIHTKDIDGLFADMENGVADESDEI